MSQPPFVNRLGDLLQQGRMLLSRFTTWLSPLFDEGLRHALWWGLMMAFTITILELCRWFWMIYPETVIGQRYDLGAKFPDFANSVLHEPHWYSALFLVTVPCLLTLALACFSRFFYFKRLLYDPFGDILRTFIWATPVAVGTGYVMIEYIDFGLEAAITLAAVPSLAFVPQAFRTANRLLPEILDCVRWVSQSVKRFQRRSKFSPASDAYQEKRAHLL